MVFLFAVLAYLYGCCLDRNKECEQIALLVSKVEDARERLDSCCACTERRSLTPIRNPRERENRKGYTKDEHHRIPPLDPRYDSIKTPVPPDEVKDDSIKTPVPPVEIKDCNLAVKSGAYGSNQVFYHDLGKKPGKVVLKYDMYGYEDQMKVYIGGRLIEGTRGYVKNKGELSFYYKPTPGRDNTCKIVIDADKELDTKWDYSIFCPE